MLQQNSTSLIIEGIRKGDKGAASRLMSMVENRLPDGDACLLALAAYRGNAHIIGITGWAGVGKSSLISRIARSYLKDNQGIGIIAVDPTSPLSGGSFLGDRERMKEIDGDDRVFIRSMATRGHTGGIARATYAFIRIMEALGKEIIILETVGVGQDQVSVTHLADTVVVTLIPGMGDFLQALKGGILEVADIFVVNKADHPGVDEVVHHLNMIIHMSGPDKGWYPPIVKTNALDGTGIDELHQAIGKHGAYLVEKNLRLPKRLSAVKMTILETLKSKSFELIAERANLTERLDAYADQVSQGNADLGSVADEILRAAGIK